MERFLIKLLPTNHNSIEENTSGRPDATFSKGNEESHISKKIRLEEQEPCTSTNVIPSTTVKVTLDLSFDCEHGPLQPKINFPKRNIGGKQRSFQSNWYEKFSWLEYSVKNDAVFCFVCRHFSMPDNLLGDVLITTGYSDWKHIGNMVVKHESSNAHKACRSKYEGWLAAKKTGAVTVKINEHLAKSIAKNRETLKSLIRGVLFCARQNIGLRGHRESGQEEEECEAEGSKGNEEPEVLLRSNSGNFKELINLLCLESKNLTSYLKNLPKNAKYTSKDIQNDILKAASYVITREIVNEIKVGSTVYSIIVDEARDEGQKEQMSICCRYLHKSEIRERFLGFIEVHELNADALANTISQFLNSIGLDMQNCVSQSFDGASVMSGRMNGVQALIREMSKNPCPYVHCHAHRLNLVLVDVSKNVKLVDETIGLLEAIYAFQSSSTLRHDVFTKSQTTSGFVKLNVTQHSDTRWVSKYKGIHFYKIRFGCVIKALTECSNCVKKREAAEAKGLLRQLSSFDVILLLVYLDEILSTVNSLSLYLQSSVIDFGKSVKLVESTKQAISLLREEKRFNELYNEAMLIAKDCNIQVPSNIEESGSKFRSQKIPDRLSDYFLTESTGKGRSSEKDADADKCRLRSIFFDIIDNILSEMERRFSGNADLIRAVCSCDPTSEIFMNSEILCSFAKAFGKDNEAVKSIRKQCDLAKTMFSSCKNVHELYSEVHSMGVAFIDLKDLLTILLVIPVSTASAERSFSTMKRIKTYLRTTMTGQRLHDLAVIAIERENSYSLLTDPEQIIDQFAS